MIRVKINASVYPTEDPDRVMAALKNMFSFEESQVHRETRVETVQLKIDMMVRYNVEVTRLVLEFDSKDCLEPLKRMFKDEHIEECARSVLYSSKHGVDGHAFRLSFRVHKQAALMGKVHFSELHESPLGPINVDITTAEPDTFIDWIAPREILPEKKPEKKSGTGKP